LVVPSLVLALFSAVDWSLLEVCLKIIASHTSAWHFMQRISTPLPPDPTFDPNLFFKLIFSKNKNPDVIYWFIDSVDLFDLPRGSGDPATAFHVAAYWGM